VDFPEHSFCGAGKADSFECHESRATIAGEAEIFGSGTKADVSKRELVCHATAHDAPTRRMVCGFNQREHNLRGIHQPARTCLKKTDDDLLNAANHKTLRVKDGFAFALWRQPANGLRYPRVGGAWIRSEGSINPKPEKCS
jgi:hypothetical protein